MMMVKVIRTTMEIRNYTYSVLFDLFIKFHFYVCHCNEPSVVAGDLLRDYILCTEDEYYTHLLSSLATQP